MKNKIRMIKSYVKERKTLNFVFLALMFCLLEFVFELELVEAAKVCSGKWQISEDQFSQGWN